VHKVIIILRGLILCVCMYKTEVKKQKCNIELGKLIIINITERMNPWLTRRMG